MPTPQQKKLAKPRKKAFEPTHVSKSDLEGLQVLLTEKWGFSPRSYQMDGIIAQLKRQDVLIHAGTGMGKTAVAAGPHMLTCNYGRVTLMVSPLIALHDEMVETFRDEFGLNATAVNSSNGGCSPDKLNVSLANPFINEEKI